MRLLKFIITICAWLTSQQYCAAQNDYTFSTFTAENGPVSSEISALFQDHQNYLWIGHRAGITRYDGNQFEDFLFAGDHQVGKVYSIAESLKGTVWIGTEQGLFLWKDENLHYIGTGDLTRPVYALHFDKAGGLWIGNSDGPYYVPATELNSISKSFHTNLNAFQLQAWRLRFPNVNKVKFISIAADNSIVFGDGDAVYQYRQKRIIPVWKSTGRLDLLNGIWAKNKDTIFICSLSGGVEVVENGTLRRPPSVDPYFTVSMQEKEGQFYELTSAGIFETDPVSLKSRRILELPEFANVWGTCLLKDSEQNFWVGSEGQLNYAARNFFNSVSIHNEISSTDFYSIFQLPGKDMLFGSNHGKSYIKTRQDSTLRQWKKIFPHAEITGFHQAENGGIWVSSSHEGLAFVSDDKIKRFTIQEGLRDNSNFFFLKNAGNELITGGDRGVTKITQAKNGKIFFRNFSFKTGSSDYVVIKSGIKTHNGQLLFGSNRGLFELINDSLMPVEIKGAQHQMHNITDMKTDALMNIWISTIGDGILICRLDNGAIRLMHKLTAQNGLPSKIILQLLVDSYGDAWAADYHSVFKIQKMYEGDYFVSQYEKKQASNNLPFNRISMLQADDGKIWLASTSGILNFSPEDNSSEIVPQLNLSRIIISSNTKIIDTLSLRTNPTLPSNTKNITFQFRGISFSNPKTVRYSYRLLGSDTLWSLAGKSQSAKFENLPPGQYTFEVRAQVSPHRWSKSIQYSFTIKPRIWDSGWFIAVLAIAAAALLLLISIRWKQHFQRIADSRLRVQQAIADNLQYRLETEKIINYFAISISEQQTVDDLVWDIVRNCISQLEFEDCVIYLNDASRNILVQKAAWGPKTDQGIIINPIEIPVGSGIVGTVAHNKKGEIVNDISRDPRYIVDDIPRNSEIAVPILAEGNLLGVIDSENSQKDFYTSRHFQILTTIASLCADKITIIKTIAEKRKAEIEVVENKQKATIARLQSMRLQMNPHFLFNSLNSIQQMILAGDETVATRSLSKFSRLLRMVLIQSDKEKISLSKELEMLQLYVELESQRFKETFEYTIECGPSIDREETLVPTLLIQPFVENAIWHGLMHKEGLRKLSIEFIDEGDLIVCTVDDNGIGRLASQHIKSGSVVEGLHTGKAIGLANDRLKIFDEFTQIKSHLTIIDKKDESGNPTGTRVIIRFPS